MAISSRAVKFHPNDGIDGDFVIRYLQSNHAQVQELCIEQLFLLNQQPQQLQYNDDDSSSEASLGNEDNNNTDNNNNNRHLVAFDELLVNHHTTLHLKYLALPRNGLGSHDSDQALLASIIRRQSETLETLDLSNNPLGGGGGGLQQELLEALVESRLLALNLTACKLGSRSAAALASLCRRNTTIRELYISNNDIGTKGMGALASEIASNATLQVLDVSYNKLKARGGSILAKALQNSETSNLRLLDISCNRIGEKGMQAFQWLLSVDKTIESFYVGSNNLGWKGAAMLASVLSVNYRLRDLRLPDNQIENEGAILIATEGLTENDTRTSALEYLDMSWNGIGEEGGIALAELLRENAKLTHLDLTGNQIACHAATAFAEALAYNLSLQELVLTKNQIRNDGAFSLALALGKPTSLIQSVYWNDNPIPPEGQQALGRVPHLRNNQVLWLGEMLKSLATGKISSVNFMNRMTGDEELLLLTDILAENHPLVRSLWLSGREATARGILPLIERALPSPSNVERIYIKAFSIGDDIAEAFGRVLCRNMTLGVLSITECNMTETGAAFLGGGLKHNSTLRRLHLDRNRIGDQGMKHLVAALPHSSLVSLAACRNEITDKTMALEHLKTLEELHLGCNRITNAGALDFCKYLEHDCKLIYLSLRDNEISRIGGETLQNFLPDNAVLEFSRNPYLR